MEKKTFAVSGMMCAHCQARVEGALRALDGVESAEGNLADKTMDVVYDADKVTVEQMQEAVANCGRYELTL
ncbi:MAG TPA: copper resistance protein CopZ [Prevotella sp.]|nr:copper resistance protein CopZ [Prevotella sp.]